MQARRDGTSAQLRKLAVWRGEQPSAALPLPFHCHSTALPLPFHCHSTAIPSQVWLGEDPAKANPDAMLRACAELVDTATSVAVRPEPEPPQRPPQHQPSQHQPPQEEHDDDDEPGSTASSPSYY